MGLTSFLRRFGRAEDGVAAVEMALVSGVLIAALLNVVEVGRYAYLSAQVTAATQAGAHAAIARCSEAQSPVTLNCPNVADEVTAAVQGTSLGALVELRGGLTEAWYCVNAQGVLEEMAAPAERPEDCADAGDEDAEAGLYLRVQTEFTYEPLFPDLTLAETFPEVIVRTAWMRLL